MAATIYGRRVQAQLYWFRKYFKNKLGRAIIKIDPLQSKSDFIQLYTFIIIFTSTHFAILKIDDLFVIKPKAHVMFVGRANNDACR